MQLRLYSVHILFVHYLEEPSLTFPHLRTGSRNLLVSQLGRLMDSATQPIIS